MDLAEYATLDATALAERIRAGELDAAAAARLALRAIDVLEPTLGATAERYDDAPERAAAEPPPADAPFAGVPFAFKDVGTAEPGRRREAGSRLLEGLVPVRGGELARRFAAAGLVAVARSAAPEFALSLSTESALRGPTRNPWDPGRIAGGSSGGAAALVASGALPLAHATDAAGSIRIPASACGLVGLKPSRGRVSHAPDAGEPLMGMDTEFALARSVRDVAALLGAVAGPAPGDPCALPPPRRPWREAPERPPAPLRVALATVAWGGYATEPEVVAATEGVARTLEAMGHTVERARPPLDYEAFVDAAIVGWAVGFDRQLELAARATGREVGPGTLEPVTLRLLERARELRGRDVARADEIANDVRRGFGTFFEAYDLLLTPTLLRLPEPFAEGGRASRYSQSAEHPDFESFFRRCDEAGAFLPPFNLTGQPAISLPLAESAGGVPIGIQFVGRVGAERTLLRLAAALERDRPWRARRPPVHAATATGSDAR